MAVKPDTSLAAATVLIAPGARVISVAQFRPLSGISFKLSRFDDATDLGRILVQQLRGGLHFDDDIR